IALVAVWRSRPRVARIAVAAQVIFVLWAWAVGQWPYLVPPDLTIADAAAPNATLTALLVVTGIGSLLLLPSLWFLFRVFKSRNPAAISVRTRRTDCASFTRRRTPVASERSGRFPGRRSCSTC